MRHFYKGFAKSLATRLSVANNRIASASEPGAQATPATRPGVGF